LRFSLFYIIRFAFPGNRLSLGEAKLKLIGDYETAALPKPIVIGRHFRSQIVCKLVTRPTVNAKGRRSHGPPAPFCPNTSSIGRIILKPAEKILVVRNLAARD
jgi:hypothetical protein